MSVVIYASLSRLPRLFNVLISVVTRLLALTAISNYCGNLMLCIRTFRLSRCR